MFALTSNVVQGKVREAPANANVPLWVRKILLRGLRPDRRPSAIPSMAELLEALGKEPAREAPQAGWRRSAAALLPVALAVRRPPEPGRPPAICGGGPARLAGVWESDAAGRARAGAAGARSSTAFLHTGKSYAATSTPPSAAR